MVQAVNPNLMREIEHYLELLIDSYDKDIEETKAAVRASGIVEKTIALRDYDRMMAWPWWLTPWRGRREYRIPDDEILDSFSQRAFELTRQTADHYQEALDQAKAGNLAPAHAAFRFMIDIAEEHPGFTRTLLAEDLSRLHRAYDEISQRLSLTN